MCRDWLPSSVAREQVGYLSGPHETAAPQENDEQVATNAVI